MDDLISRLSEIRSNYNCMDEKEEPYYRALSEAIQLAIRTARKTHACDLVDRQSAINIVEFECGKWRGLAKTIVEEIEQLPSAQPETHEERTETHACDLIDRRAVIDALAKFVPYAICDESTESYTNGLTDAYNLILQLPSAQPERWIKCSERLPETHTQYIDSNPWPQMDFLRDTYQLSDAVLGYGRRKHFADGDPMISVVWYEEDDGRGVWQTAPDCEDIDVIAWMPLPEPYKENKDERD